MRSPGRTGWPAALLLAGASVGACSSRHGTPNAAAPAASTPAAACATPIGPATAGGIPPDVAAWAHGVPVIGGGALWTIRSAVDVAATAYRAGWHLKFPWYTRPNGLPKIEGRRLDGSGTFSYDVNTAYDSTGPFVTSTLDFSDPGCWEVTGRFDNSMLQFRLRVGP